MRRLLLGMVFALANPAFASPSTDLKAVVDQHWRWWLENHPVEATSLGVHDWDMLLDDISLGAADRQAADEQKFLDRMTAIPDAGLSDNERVDKGVLAEILRTDVAGNRFGERQMLFTTYYSWPQGFAGLADNLPFRTGHDYESYVARLSQYPQYNAEAMKITRAAVAGGYVQPCAVLEGFEKTITGVIAASPEQTRFYAPFLRAKPVDMDEAAWTALKSRAAAVIRDSVEPEYKRFADYYLAEYKPHCRASVGASEMPQGRDWYALQVRLHTTSDLTPEQIHQKGLSEVARIRAEMDAVAKGAGYPSRAAMIAHMRSDPASYVTTPRALLQAAAYQNKLIDGLLPRYFGKLPRLTFTVKPIPAETAEGTTTAYSQPGSIESGVAGVYFVNTSKLDQRPLYELPALTAHEASPGHQLQLSLQQELALSEFRKHVASFTAYVEGWALYTEHLGAEMGLYDTPEKDMSRLSYEMWRACRLVVDTGLHSKGWTKAQAIAFMHDNTALTDANIEAEVNRYISWPGQALGYKLGELKIRELRARAEKTLGSKFDLRAFHDEVLGLGPVPLDVLEREVDSWVAARAR
ncbi:MAG: DUF885 domain-containing protein [Sphingomonadaceae bacterium]|nr:DUF885 domain-containing protein [Sphingomonadaceae bacterium]